MGWWTGCPVLEVYRPTPHPGLQRCVPALVFEGGGGRKDGAVSRSSRYPAPVPPLPPTPLAPRVGLSDVNSSSDTSHVSRVGSVASRKAYVAGHAVHLTGPVRRPCPSGLRGSWVGGGRRPRAEGGSPVGGSVFVCPRPVHDTGSRPQWVRVVRHCFPKDVGVDHTLLPTGVWGWTRPSQGGVVTPSFGSFGVHGTSLRSTSVRDGTGRDTRPDGPRGLPVRGGHCESTRGYVHYTG